MSDIQRYVVLDADGHQESGEYDTLDEAREAAQRTGGAVEAHIYEWSDSELVWTPNGETEWPPPATTATCPCGATDHVIADHPTAQVAGFHPVIGTYIVDDPIAEHRDGEHDVHPDPDSCAACAALGDG